MTDTPKTEITVEPPAPRQHIGDRYLRNRPFLVINVSARPSSQAKTQVRGWLSRPENTETFESASIVDRVTDNVITNSILIIDIINTTIVRNRLAEKPDEDKLIKHFMSKYSDKVTEGLRIWAQQRNIPVDNWKDNS